jgi:competence protein ComEA
MKLSLSGRAARVRVAMARVYAAIAAWRWATPVARVVLLGAALVALACIGRSTMAGATAAVAVDDAGARDPPAIALTASAADAAPARIEAPVVVAPAPTELRRGPASAEDPVVLNAASEEDLRRLPGIGAKRAQSILALRAKMGRFKQVEDLMKVRGIGRVTLKRLRPLVRLDAPATADAGAG